MRDEVGDILLEGGETETTEQTSSPKKPHHQPRAPRLAPQEPRPPPNQHGFATSKSRPVGEDMQLPTESHHPSTPLNTSQLSKTNANSLAAWSNVAPATRTEGSSANNSSSRRASTANAEKPCRPTNTALDTKYSEQSYENTPRTGNSQNSAALAEFIKDPGAFTFTGDKGLLTFFDEPEPPDIGSEDGSPNDAEQ